MNFKDIEYLITISQELINLTAPAFYLMRYFDDPSCCIGSVFRRITDYLVHIKSCKGTYIDQSILDKATELFLNRWIQMKGDLPFMLAAHAFNPAEIGTDISSEPAVTKAVHLFLKSNLKEEDLNEALMEYSKLYNDNFSQDFYQNANKMTPYDWWFVYGYNFPTIKDICLSLHTMQVSASSCERNWSVWERFYSSSRWRLDTDLVDKMVFICQNNKLMMGQKIQRARRCTYNLTKIQDKFNVTIDNHVDLTEDKIIEIDEENEEERQETSSVIELEEIPDVEEDKEVIEFKENEVGPFAGFEVCRSCGGQSFHRCIGCDGYTHVVAVSEYCKGYMTINEEPVCGICSYTENKTARKSHGVWGGSWDNVEVSETEENEMPLPPKRQRKGKKHFDM